MAAVLYYLQGADARIPVYFSDGKMMVSPSEAGLAIPDHDAEVYGYTGSDLTTIVYKTGGVSGLTVATMTMVYSTGILQSRALT